MNLHLTGVTAFLLMLFLVIVETAITDYKELSETEKGRNTIAELKEKEERFFGKIKNLFKKTLHA